MSGSEHNVADLLNRGCDCAVTDLPKLRERLETALEPAQSIVDKPPASLFRDTGIS